MSSPHPATLRRVLLAAVLVLGITASFFVWHRRRLQPRPQRLPTDLSQWQAYEGNWSVRNGEITDLTGGRGDKLMTGDPNLNDVVVRTDLRFDSDRDYEFGDAGLVLRASNLTVGTDSLYGYYVGIRPGAQTVQLGRMQDEYIDLALRQLDRPVRVNAWYTLHIEVRACTFVIQVNDAENVTMGTLHYDDRDCVLRAGQVGLRSYGMIASWRNLSLQPLP